MQQLPKLFVGETIASHVIESDIPSMTALFRTENQVDVAVDQAVSRYALRPVGASGQFTIISAACSVGAELDSALVYATRLEPQIGSIAAYGVDINSTTIAAAKRNRYVVGAQYTEEYMKETKTWIFEEVDLAQILPEFDVTSESANTSTGTDSADTIPSSTFYDMLIAKYVINTERLRSKHDVHFICDDITKPSMLLPQADLILCNRLLEHLDPLKAVKVVENLTGLLKAQGVLSIGAFPAEFYHQSVINDFMETLPLRPIATSLYQVESDRPQRTPFLFETISH